jgi:hypothetical protein
MWALVKASRMQCMGCLDGSKPTLITLRGETHMMNVSREIFRFVLPDVIVKKYNKS